MAPITRARRAREAASSDRLPADVLSDVLQRFPAKELCRLRTVCSSWRSVITDQAFITAHADSHKEPLFLARLRDDKTHAYVMDLSGNLVKKMQIPGAGDGGLQVLRTRLDLACLASEWNKCRVLSPATGGIRQVPSLVLDPNRRRNVSTFFSFGLVASTQEYKLLRCLITFNEVVGREQLSGVQVLTIDGGTDHAQWRRAPGPPLSIDGRGGVVVDGVVYFLTSEDYFFPLELTRSHMALFHDGVPADYIVSFDLEREEWGRILYGPSGRMACTGNVTSGPMVTCELTLADLKGSLVLAHHPRSLSIMDLWFLLDFESRVWVKQYSVRTESVTTSLGRYQLIPLLALDDGRLVFHVAPHGLCLICDPATNAFTNVNTRDHIDSVAVYTGSLLSLQEGDKVVYFCHDA